MSLRSPIRRRWRRRPRIACRKISKPMAAASRYAWPAARARSSSINCSRRMPSETRFRGTACIGSLATSASCHQAIPSTTWHGAAELPRSLCAGRQYPSHRYRCCLIPTKRARQYESELKSFYGADELDPARPLFDLVLMGVGPDGHTASLFPGYPAIDETSRWVTGVPKANVAPFVPRVSLTLPTLASCREMLFEAAGVGKARDLDAPTRRREPAGEPRALHRRDDLAGRQSGAAGEFSWP